MSVNEEEDRMELIMEDISWHFSFFGPAWKAYSEGRYEDLEEIVERYREVVGGV